MKNLAVEFIVQRLTENGILHSSDICEAKELEMENIIETAGYYFHERGKLTPKQYYQKTFKSE